MRRADWLFGAGLLLLTSLATALLAAPVVTEPGRVLYGEPGDVYGTLAVLRQVAAGLSEPLTLPWGPGLQPLVDLPAGLVARWVGAVASYNLFLLLSFPLAALAAWALGMRLLGERWSAGFVALAFAFSPYHLAHARAHLDQAQVQWVPLVAWAAVGFAERPGLKRALVLGACYAAALLSNYYFAYLLGFMVLVMAAPALTGRARRRAAWLLLAVVAALLAGWLAARPGASPAGERQAALGDLTRYSARPAEYLLPPRQHPLLGDLVRDLPPGSAHGSNPIEQSLYLGLVPLGLAVLGLGRSLRGRGGLSRRWALTLLALAVAAFVLSLPPDWRLGSLRLAGPHHLLVTIAPWFRAVARFGCLVQLAVVLLAGAALCRRGEAGRPALALVATALVLFEYADQPPRPRHRTDPPELLADLVRGAQGVADYPLTAYRYLRLWEPLAGKRLPSQALRRAGLERLEWPGSPPVLSALGVSHVIWHADAAVMPGLPDGVRLLSRHESSWLLEVTAPPAEAALVYTDGFHVPEPVPGGVQAWLQEAGVLRVLLHATAASGDLVADTWSLGEPRTLELTGPAGLRETTTVGVEPESRRWSGLRLAGPVSLLRFAPRPGPALADEVLANGDPRRLSLALARAAFRPRELDFAPAGRIVFGQGFHELEPDGRRWLRARSRLSLGPGQGRRQLRLELTSHLRVRRVEVREAERLLMALEAKPERFESVTLPLEPRACDLEIVVLDGEEMAGADDARLVAVAWRHVRLEQRRQP